MVRLGGLHLHFSNFSLGRFFLAPALRPSAGSGDPGHRLPWGLANHLQSIPPTLQATGFLLSEAPPLFLFFSSSSLPRHAFVFDCIIRPAPAPAPAPVGYKSRLDASSMFGANQKIIDDEVMRKEVEYENSKEILEISKLYEVSEISFHTRVMAASSPKVAALEAAKKLKATWIILDRQMKKDKKYFMDRLSCGISRMKRNNSVELLRGPKGIPRNSEHTEGIASSNVKDTKLLPGPEVKQGTYAVIRDSLEDDDLFSLELFPMNSKSTDKSTSIDEMGIDSGKGPPGASSVVSSFPMPTSLEAVSFVNTALTYYQRGYEFLSGSKSNEAELPLQLQQGYEFITTQSETDDDSIFIFNHSKIECIGSNPSIVQEAEQEQANTEEIYKQLEERVENSVCLYCWSEGPKIELMRDFTYDELKDATNEFCRENFLSEGGFGSVYKGRLKDGHYIAVKQHKHASLQGEKEFRSEVHVLSKARHKNVVRLLGSCSEGRQKLLVYEYICNGSLDIHLSKNTTRVLTWKNRMDIAFGVAKGLNYLHQNNIIHRDMRPNNILINHNYEPLLGDFGLAKTQHNEADHSSENKVVGTFGYLAPEYAERGRVSTKTDVYSFGVVLLELIAGRTTIGETLGEKSLVGWARPLLKEKKYPELIDERILDCHDVHELFWMVHVAEICLFKDPEKRPSMQMVEEILQRIIDGETFIGIEDFSPTRSSDGSCPRAPESQDGQETDLQDYRCTDASSISRSQKCEAVSSTWTQSSRSQTSTSLDSSISGRKTSPRKKREKSRSKQVLYDEMLT